MIKAYISDVKSFVLLFVIISLYYTTKTHKQKFINLMYLTIIHATMFFYMTYHTAVNRNNSA